MTETRFFFPKCRMFVSILALCALPAGLLVLPSAARAQSPDDILVVVNKSVAKTQSVSMGELRAMYLKSRLKWADGQKVRPIHAFSDEKLRLAFNTLVLRMSLDEERAFWEEKKIKQGEVKPPAHKDPLVPVGRDTGSVGYVYRKNYREGDFRILTVIPASPEGAVSH
ncbi:MAG: hypothetical protein MUC50_07340 [Myxococcota bacterium]|jgi:hypothetical protein|nr:hypothetical protein [Myxococcota bacterium]